MKKLKLMTTPLPHDVKLMFCGGSTGGHLFPALAVFEEVQRRSPNASASFLSTGRPTERAILEREQIPLHVVDGINGTELIRRFWSAPWKLYKAIRAAKQYLEEVQPDCVIGCGGYASVPGILAARWLKLPVLLMEQNLIPGRATSFLSRFACGVCVAFSETIDQLPKSACSVWTGNPVRREITQLAECHGSEHLNETVLVLGGSQGSSALTKAVLELVETQPELFRNHRVILQTGNHAAGTNNDPANHNNGVECVPFLDDVAAAYREAAIIICRSGATTLAEVACAGVAGIAVPIPGSVRDHQLLNARWYDERGAMKMVEQPSQSDASGHGPFVDELSRAVGTLLPEMQSRKQMEQRLRELAIPDAARKVVDVIENRIARAVENSTPVESYPA